MGFMIFAILLGCLTAHAEPSLPIESTAKQLIVLDYQTGEVLLSKNADDLMIPSSMTKIMTVYLVFQKLKSGKLKPTDEFRVSERAWRLQGSKMFVDLDSTVKVDDLLRGIIVQSGNDACVVVAEGLAGSEEAFAQQMTRVAHQIGATSTTFLNASGWPEEGHLTTARDLATIGTHTIQDFPQYYSLYQEREFTYNGIHQGNRNVLLDSRLMKVDGLKTGHTEAGGFGIVVSAVKNGRRLVLVGNGYKSMSERAKDAEQVLNWAFRETDLLRLFPAGHTIGTTAVWHGKNETLNLTTEKPVQFVVPRRLQHTIKVRAVYPDWVKAPVKAGDVIGKLFVQLPENNIPQEIPLVAAEGVERTGFIGRMVKSITYMLFGKK